MGASVNSPVVEAGNPVLGMHVAEGMAPVDKGQLLAALCVPFDLQDIRWIVKATSKTKNKGMVLPYADQRAYTDRLNSLVTAGGWSRKYVVDHVTGFDRAQKKGNDKTQTHGAKVMMVCELTIVGIGTHSGTGESWADDDNAMTSSEAQAFKRAAACFGLGRYLYDVEGQWVDLDEHKQPKYFPKLPQWALPPDARGKSSGTGKTGRSNGGSTSNGGSQSGGTGNGGSNGDRGSKTAENPGQVESEARLAEFRKSWPILGKDVFLEAIGCIGIPNLKQLASAAKDSRMAAMIRESLLNAVALVEKLKAAIAIIGMARYESICRDLGHPKAIEVSGYPSITALIAVTKVAIKASIAEGHPKSLAGDTGPSDRARTQPTNHQNSTGGSTTNPSKPNQALGLNELRNQLIKLAQTCASEWKFSLPEVIRWASEEKLEFRKLGKLTEAEKPLLVKALARLEEGRKSVDDPKLK